jgi:ribosomal protein S18 acetylase RimI-like enzyme
MNLKMLPMSEIDIDAHAQLIYESRQKSPLRNDTRTIEGIKQAIQSLKAQGDEFVMFAALDERNKRLLGQLLMWLEWGEMSIARPWQPIVHPEADQETVAIALINQAKILVESHSKSRLEVWMELRSEKDEEMSSVYIPWYEKCGYELTAEEYFMDTNYSKLRALEASIPNGIEVVAMSELSYEKLKNAVLSTFRNGADKWFETMTQSQQESSADAWLKTDETLDDNASIVFMEDGNIIGYNIMKIVEDQVEVGPIGVLPSHRKRGFGHSLLLTSVRRLESKRPKRVWLTVSTDNAPAYDLYSSLGFVNQYRILIYTWMP